MMSVFQSTFISENFYILKTVFGRGVFNIFVCMMALFNGSIMFIIFALGYAVIGGLHIYLVIKDPLLDDKVNEMRQQVFAFQRNRDIEERQALVS